MWRSRLLTHHTNTQEGQPNHLSVVSLNYLQIHEAVKPAQPGVTLSSVTCWIFSQQGSGSINRYYRLIRFIETLGKGLALSTLLWLIFCQVTLAPKKIERKQSNCAIKSTVERQLLSSSAAHWSTAIKRVQLLPAASTKGHRNSSQVFPGCKRGKSRMCAVLYIDVPRGRLIMSDRCSFCTGGKLVAAEGMNVCEQFNGFSDFFSKMRTASNRARLYPTL